MYTPKSRISCPGTVPRLRSLFPETRFTFDLVALRQTAPTHGRTTTCNRHCAQVDFRPIPGAVCGTEWCLRWLFTGSVSRITILATFGMTDDDTANPFATDWAIRTIKTDHFRRQNVFSSPNHPF